MDLLNNNLFIVSFTTLLANLGSKYVYNDFSEELEELFDTPLVRKIVIFAMVYGATRDFMLACSLMLIYIIATNQQHIVKKIKEVFGYVGHVKKKLD